MIVDETVNSRGDINSLPRTEFYKQVANASSKSVKAYASSIGVNYKYTESPYFKYKTKGSEGLLYEVSRLWMDSFFDDYDDVLFLDTDILISKQAGNIFEHHSNDISGVLESEIFTSKGANYAPWHTNENKLFSILNTYKKGGVPIHSASVYPPLNPCKILCMNTGVMVWSKSARLKARKEFMNWWDWYEIGVERNNPMWLNNDQFYISAMCVKHDMKINFLGQEWNDSPHYDSKETLLKRANFLHFTGGPWKINMLEWLKEKNFGESVF